MLAGVRAEIVARQGLAQRALGIEGQGRPADGIHVRQPLQSNWTGREVATAARALGLAVTPGELARFEPNVSTCRLRQAVAVRCCSRMPVIWGRRTMGTDVFIKHYK
jgi:hypothetical protein